MDDRSEESTETVAEPGARKTGARVAVNVPKVVLGRYEIVDELGQGGMGFVYRARDKQLGRDVAIKFVGGKKELTDMLATRLLREAQALAQLSHPNVVTIYDVGEAEGRVFVVMELIEGVAGDEWSRKGQAWRDVVRVFRDAGRGLAAAHAVGLVHRDFKPANLMIGDDGRVRVLDFGLARTATAAQMGSDAAIGISDETPGNETTADSSDTAAPTRAKVPVRQTSETEVLGPGDKSESPFPSQHRASLLESPLTQVGVIVGTPPYMAPEQHRGGASDARSDQFSYCVSFYRSLYGQRPFSGNTYGEVKANILAGKVRPPPTNIDVPGWVRDIVLRGLATDPEKRWPSMDALLDALARDPAARRRKLLLWAAGAVLVAGAGGAVWYAQRNKVSCVMDATTLSGVWDAKQKSAIETAFIATKKPFANASLARVTRTLDEYTSRWLAMRVEACEATNVHGTQSAELLDLRMACLQRRLDDVRALVGVLANADQEVVTRATDVTSTLPALESCADTEALRAPVRAPSDPAIQKRVEAAQRTLAGVRALWIAGRYTEAQEQLAPVLREARALNWRPLEGEALLTDARLADSTGDYQRAAKSFKEAAVAAEAGRDDETAALARNGLVWVTGERLGKYAEAQELAVEAAAKVERLGRRELLQADLDQKMSALFFEQGNFAEAAKRSRSVLEIRQKLLDADDPAIATALGDLGDIAVQQAQYDDAIDAYRKALAVAERSIGPDHSLCGALRGNLGNALAAKGERIEALEQLLRARDITERSLGPDHAQIATISINIGNILLEQDKPAEAGAHFAKATKIWTKSLGADHPNVATALFRGGEVALRQGKAREASAAFQRALEIWQSKLGADHPSLAAAYIGLAQAAVAEKRDAAAVAHYQRSIALLEKAFGSSHPELVSVLVGLGSAQEALRKTRPARATLDRALEIVEAGEDPTEQARGRFDIARVLVKLDKARAKSLATAAHATLAKAGPEHAAAAQDIATWLEGRQ